MYKMEVNLEAVNGGVDCALLVAKDDIFAYENGKRVSEIRTGVKLLLALQNARLANLTVKFDHDPLPKITDEQIAAMGLGETSAAANGRVFRVDIQQFENLSIRSIKTLCGIANEVYGNIIQPPVIETEE